MLIVIFEELTPCPSLGKRGEPKKKHIDVKRYDVV
jgi:hypothetical protein